MKLRKITALFSALVIAVGLTACAGTTTETTTAEGTTQATTATEATAAETTKGSELITVGFAQVGHESDWRTASTNSVKAALSKDNGFDLQFVDCDNDSAAQLEAVRNFIEQDVDYIVIDPIVATGWDTVLTEAKDAGIPVIVLDRTIDDSDKYVAWIGSEFTNEGLAAGAWLQAYAELKGIKELNILVIEGTTGASAQIGRTDGFKKIADANGWNILDSQSGEFTQDGGQAVMESYCKSYEGKFNVVVCQNDNEAFGAEDAMDAAGVTYGVKGDVILISFDSTKAGLTELLAGNFNSDFQCNPLQGPSLADLLNKLVAGETVDTKQFMPETWYVNESDLKSITYTNVIDKSVTEDLVVVTQDMIDNAQY